MSYNIPNSPSSVDSPEDFNKEIQYNILDAPYLDPYSFEADSLGITYGDMHSGQPSYFSNLDFGHTSHLELPHRPLFHSNTFPLQPAIHLNEPTPVSPHGPPRLFTQLPHNNDHENQDDLWSPSSFFSASSLRRSRSQSFSDRFVSTDSSHGQLTPERKSRASVISTPRQQGIATSPLLSGLRTPERTRAPSPRRFYTPIAPNPTGMQQLNSARHRRNDEELDWPSAKRHKSIPTSPSPQIELSDEDRLLLKLKDEDGLSWRDIQARFLEELGQEHNQPALQMRINRLRRRLQVWTDVDVEALRRAHDYWMENKFDIISSKMSDFGSTGKWTKQQCRQKWLDLCLSTEFNYNQPTMRAPMFSTAYNGSPIEQMNLLGLHLNTRATGT